MPSSEEAFEKAVGRLAERLYVEWTGDRERDMWEPDTTDKDSRSYWARIAARNHLSAITPHLQAVQTGGEAEQRLREVEVALATEEEESRAVLADGKRSDPLYSHTDRMQAKGSLAACGVIRRALTSHPASTEGDDLGEIERLRGRLKQIEIYMDGERSDRWKVESAKEVARAALATQEGEA